MDLQILATTIMWLLFLKVLLDLLSKFVINQHLACDNRHSSCTLKSSLVSLV